MLKDIKKALVESYDSDTSKKQIGVIRLLYDTIIKLKDGGMSMDKIRDVLAEQGVNISTAVLVVYVGRIKKERAKAAAIAAAAAPVVVYEQPRQQVESKPTKISVKNEVDNSAAAVEKTTPEAAPAPAPAESVQNFKKRMNDTEQFKKYFK